MISMPKEYFHHHYEIPLVRMIVLHSQLPKLKDRPPMNSILNEYFHHPRRRHHRYEAPLV